MEQTVLVVDDEPNIVHLARLYLTSDGFRVQTASDGQEALDKLRGGAVDLVVLDLMMPGIDGWEVCRRIRKDSDVPIIILTARSDDVDKIVGLELGADDYVTKPFNPRELVARVKAVLRRAQPAEKKVDLVVAGNLRIDLQRREVTVGGRQIELRPKEYDLLVTFAQNPGIVLDRERLIAKVWGYDYVGESRTIDVHVTWLRDKIQDATVQIQTVWGVGYKLVERQPAAS